MTIDEIARDIESCTRCPLHKWRTTAVPGEGPADAGIVLVGEAPGRREDELGRPFAGRSGRVLDEILEHAGILRSDVFITSIVKCRPPNNRRPYGRERQTCAGRHLIRQFEVIGPRIICLLGRTATETLLGIKTITRHRGCFLSAGSAAVLPTLHPAGAGRNPAWRRLLLNDMKKLRRGMQNQEV